MCKAAPLLVLVLLLLTCCEQHPVVRDPPREFISMDDSCGNYYPPYADAGFKPANDWPFLAEAAGGQVSPDGNYLAYRGMNTDYLQHGHSFPISGLAVMGLRSNSHLLFIRALGFTWSQDSRRLYYYNRANIVCATDMYTKETRCYPELGQPFERIASAPNGRLILLTGVKAGVPEYGIVKYQFISLGRARYHWVTSMARIALESSPMTGGPCRSSPETKRFGQDSDGIRYVSDQNNLDRSLPVKRWLTIQSGI